MKILLTRPQKGRQEVGKQVFKIEITDDLGDQYKGLDSRAKSLVIKTKKFVYDRTKQRVDVVGISNNINSHASYTIEFIGGVEGEIEIDEGLTVIRLDVKNYPKNTLYHAINKTSKKIE